MINMSKIFGERLRKIRQDNDYSQQEIAKIFNVSKMTISAWETNKQEPNIDCIKRLCNLFNVTADYLIGYDEYKE